MCFSPPKPPPDNSGAIAAQQEATREANIKTGQSNIDSAFTQYDDPYYAGITSNYENYYDPQIDVQYKDAVDKLTEQLGQQGILQSSEGNRQLGELAQKEGQTLQSIADQGIAAANTAKQQVASTKQNLYQLNQNAADPSLAASQAATAASSAVSPITFSPIANAFSGLLGQGTNALALQSGQNVSGFGSFLPLPSNTAGIGSGNTSSGSSVSVVN